MCVWKDGHGAEYVFTETFQIPPKPNDPVRNTQPPHEKKAMPEATSERGVKACALEEEKSAPDVL